MHKSFLIKLIHISVFLSFVLLYICFEEQEMVAAMMYHVDQTANYAPYRNLVLLAATVFMMSCCVLGHFPRIFFSRLLLFMYMYIVTDSMLHGPVEGTGVLSYVMLFCATLLPLLVYNVSFNAAIKLSPKIIEILMGGSLVVLAVFYALTFKMVALSYVLDEEFRDGTVYVFMMFLPFIMTLSNRKFRIVGILLIFVALASSLKRGGLVVSVVALVTYYLVNQRVSGKRTPGIVKLVAFASVLTVMVAGILYLNYTTDGMIFDRFANMESDGGSGRDVVYSTTWSLITDSNFMEMIIGHGWNTVQADSPLNLSAHCDYLEALYDLGIIGFLFLFSLLLSVWSVAYKLIKSKSAFAPAYAASFVIFLITTLISHLFLYPLHMSAIAFFWGYVAGREDCKRKNAVVEVCNNPLNITSELSK